MGEEAEAVRQRSHRSPQRLRKGLLAGLVAVACVVAGGLAGAAIVWDRAPTSLSAAVKGGTAAVSRLRFSDPTQVSLNVALAAPVSLKSPTGGVVSASACKSGAVISSGQAPFAVNGQPILALATTVPLWRDIAANDSGADVVAVATALKQLGDYAGDVKAPASAALFAAFKTAETKIGVDAKAMPAAAIPQAAIMWIPSQAVTIGSCAEGIAAQVTAGQDLASLNTPLASAQITTDLSGLTPGKRVLTVAGTVIKVDGQGRVTDPADLAKLASLPGIAGVSDSSALSAVPGDYSLAQPIDAAVIPAAAVHQDSTGATCAVQDGKAYKLSVISSQLGSSYVNFSGAAPDRVQLNPPDSLKCQ